jgi:hypothetical protein
MYHESGTSLQIESLEIQGDIFEPALPLLSTRTREEPMDTR